MSMPGDKRFFGREPAETVMGFLREWDRNGYSHQDRVYLGAIETLRAYRQRLEETPPKPEIANQLLPQLDEFLVKDVNAHLATPITHLSEQACTYETFLELCQTRRSVRNFTNRGVDIDLVHQAIEAAQLSPSACNRQPAKVHIYKDPAKIAHLMQLQNGNRGFGQTVPMLLIMTADAKGFFDASERHEPYIDGGLFTMSLLLALQSHGLGTCCLNWCVAPRVDRLAHEWGQIPENEKIIMYLAVGYAAPETVVPRSPRRPLDTIVTMHN